MKRLITLVAISLFLLSSTAPVFAKNDSSEDLSGVEVVGDILWVRPLGLMKIALGATAFVISLPVTIPLKKMDEAKEFLIEYPYYYYFKRPLREM
jgi:hypothetical protein